MRRALIILSNVVWLQDCDEAIAVHLMTNFGLAVSGLEPPTQEGQMVLVSTQIRFVYSLYIGAVFTQVLAGCMHMLSARRFCLHNCIQLLTIHTCLAYSVQDHTLDNVLRLYCSPPSHRDTLLFHAYIPENRHVHTYANIHWGVSTLHSY